MKISGLLFLTFIIGSKACCPEKIEEKTSKDCDACAECKYPNDDTKRSMDMWCKTPVCGSFTKMGFQCPITYHGLCGLTKCAKGVPLSKAFSLNSLHYICFLGNARWRNMRRWINWNRFNEMLQGYVPTWKWSDEQGPMQKCCLWWRWSDLYWYLRVGWMRENSRIVQIGSNALLIHFLPHRE